MSEIQLLRMITLLDRRLERLEVAKFTHYKGTSAADFTTTTLPHHGDYGFQTTDSEVQMNCNGTIRAWSTAAL